MSSILKVSAKFTEPEIYPDHHNIIGESVDFAASSLSSRVKSLSYTSGDGSLEVQFIRVKGDTYSPDDKDSLENKMNSYGSFSTLSVSLS